MKKKMDSFDILFWSMIGVMGIIFIGCSVLVYQSLSALGTEVEKRGLRGVWEEVYCGEEGCPPKLPASKE